MVRGKKSYYPQLQAMADTLKAHPSTLAIVTGSADGYRYRSQNDAKNPSLALGRAHALRDVLVLKFGVDSAQVVVQSKEVSRQGGMHRSARAQVVWEQEDLGRRVNALENRPPIEKHFTQIKEVSTPPLEHMGLKLSAGFSSSPFGGVPIVSGAVTWKRKYFVEAEFGHTFWNGSYEFNASDLNTKRRYAAGYLLYFPFEKTPVGFLAGWIRAEEISQQFYKYVKLSEGPLVGVRVTPLDYLSITGAYNPSKRRVAGLDDSEMKRDQFSLSVALQVIFGGAR